MKHPNRANDFGVQHIPLTLSVTLENQRSAPEQILSRAQSRFVRSTRNRRGKLREALVPRNGAPAAHTSPQKPLTVHVTQGSGRAGRRSGFFRLYNEVDK